jgi:hypothetical protein
LSETGAAVVSLFSGAEALDCGAAFDLVDAVWATALKKAVDTTRAIKILNANLIFAPWKVKFADSHFTPTYLGMQVL